MTFLEILLTNFYKQYKVFFEQIPPTKFQVSKCLRLRDREKRLHFWRYYLQNFISTIQPMSSRGHPQSFKSLVALVQVLDHFKHCKVQGVYELQFRSQRRLKFLDYLQGFQPSIKVPSGKYMSHRVPLHFPDPWTLTLALLAVRFSTLAVRFSKLAVRIRANLG